MRRQTKGGGDRSRGTEPRKTVSRSHKNAVSQRRAEHPGTPLPPPSSLPAAPRPGLTEREPRGCSLQGPAPWDLGTNTLGLRAQHGKSEDRVTANRFKVCCGVLWVTRAFFTAETMKRLFYAACTFLYHSTAPSPVPPLPQSSAKVLEDLSSWCGSSSARKDGQGHHDRDGRIPLGPDMSPAQRRISTNT